MLQLEYNSLYFYYNSSVQVFIKKENNNNIKVITIIVMDTQQNCKISETFETQRPKWQKSNSSCVILYTSYNYNKVLPMPYV